jgi:histidinol-phosphate aminotransferase
MTYERAPAAPAGLRLHLNENTAGCSPAVLSALRSITRTELAEYPDYSAVTADLEAAYGVGPGWVQLLNGLDEGLHVVAQAARLDEAEFEGVVVEPAFEMYAACIAAAGGRQVSVEPAVDLAFSLDAVLHAIKPQTRVIYLCDPNNPSGQPIPSGQIPRIAEAAPRATVLVDEAYADFSGRTIIGSDLDRHRNIVVGRTFAKAHGLAGLRVGALIAHPSTLAPLRRILPPYSLNVCAVRALQAALADAAYVTWYVEQARQSRQLIYDWCGRFGVTFWKSEGNFVLLRVGEKAPALVAALAASGIHIRDRSRQPGCAGTVRITAGVVDHTERCLAAMEEWNATRGR